MLILSIFLKTFRVYSGGSSLVAIKSIEVARRAEVTFLINGSDRVLPVYDLEKLKEPLNDKEEEE